jgi:YVTN family beta-propeller protein
MLVPAGAGVAAAARPSAAAPLAHASPPVGPWDPLLGDPALGVPRYQVTTTPPLAPERPGEIGGTPVWLAFDSADDSFWVAVLGNGASEPGSVDRVPANSTYTVSASVPVGVDPFGVAVDLGSGNIFVTNSGSGNVTWINGSSGLPIGSIGVGSQPMGIADDPVDNELFVANEGSDNVSVLGPTRGVDATIGVGSAPIGIAYDSATGEVYVANSGSYDVSVISTATDRVVATVPVGITPYGVAVDNATDNVYVSNEGSSNLSVIQGSTSTVVASVPVIVPGSALLQGLTYDSRTGELWVGAGNSYLVLVNATAESVAFVYTTDPAGVAYDPGTGTVCYTNTDNSTFECMSPSGPLTDDVPVTFTETGLPIGSNWAVSVYDGPGLGTNGTRIVFDLCPSVDCVFGTTYTFVVPSVSGYVASTPYPRVSIADAAVNVSISFHSGPPEHLLHFDETGLAWGVGWSVILNGSLAESSDSSLSFEEPNGSYSFTIGPVTNYFASPDFGTIGVLGGAATVNLTYSIVTWGIYFDESGLPPATPWEVTFTSGPPGFTLPTSGPTSASSVFFALANGTYTYFVATTSMAYTPPPSGSFFVNGGPPYSVSIVFTAVLYNVSFQESGLPPGTNWAVNLTGQFLATTATGISVLEPSGTFGFAVGAVQGYRATPSSGSVIVDGASPAPVNISFASTWTFSATFHETGLPGGTGWSVAIGSEFQSSVTSNVTLFESNGTYGYVIQSVSGYSTTYSGLVTLDGANVTVPVPFSDETFPVLIVEVGLPNGTNWSVTVSNATTGFSVVHSTNGSALIFDLPNGTYSVFVQVPPGYSASLSSTTFTVAGLHVAPPTVQASPVGPSRGNPTTTGPASTSVSPLYWIALGAMGAVIVLLVAFVIGSRRPPPSPPNPSRAP